MKSNGMVRKYSSPFQWDILEQTSESVLGCIPILLLMIVTLPYLFSGYWEDEIFSVTTSRSWSGMFDIFRNYENNMSFYFLVLHFWMKVFGEGEAATHALSLLFSMITIPVFYRLSRVWFNKITSFVACLLLAANPLFVYYAVETRSYSMLILSATLSTLIFIHLVKKPGFRLGLIYGLLVASGVYVHYFGILLPMVHGLSVRRNGLNRLLIASFLLSILIIVVGTLPLVLFPPHNKNQIDWISKPEMKYLGYTIKDLFGGTLVLLVLFFCLFFFLRNRTRKGPVKEVIFLYRLSLIWTILPCCLIFLFSCLIKPVFLTRFFVWCLPGSVLLTCLIVGSLAWDTLRKSILWLLLLIILLNGSYRILNTRGSGYKEAVQYLNEKIRPGESVLTYPYYKSIHTTYYLDKMHSAKPFARPLDITRMPYLSGGGGRDPDPDMETLRKVAADNGKVYLICKGMEELNSSDSMQNRTWLPEIQKIIGRKHPRQEDRIFGIGSQEPIRIIIYE